MSPREILFQSFAGLSGFCSGGVVLTGLVFPSMMLAQTHPFSHIIFFISLCDLFASATSAFGFPTDGSFICGFQGFWFLFAIPASWVWTTVLVYQLRCLLINKRLWLSLPACHAIAWLVPLTLALLPLSSNRYGVDDDLQGEVPCSYAGNLTTKYFWIITVFYGLSVGCFSLMIYWMVEVRRHFGGSGIHGFIREYEIYRATRLYPVGLFITWVPSAVVYITRLVYSDAFKSEESLYVLFNVALNVQTQYGTILALIFFTSSPQARSQWNDVFRERKRSVSVHFSGNTSDFERRSTMASYRGNSMISPTDEYEDREDVIMRIRSPRTHSQAHMHTPASSRSDFTVGANTGKLSDSEIGTSSSIGSTPPSYEVSGGAGNNNSTGDNSNAGMRRSSPRVSFFNIFGRPDSTLSFSAGDASEARGLTDSGDPSRLKAESERRASATTVGQPAGPGSIERPSRSTMDGENGRKSRTVSRQSSTSTLSQRFSSSSSSSFLSRTLGFGGGIGSGSAGMRRSSAGTERTRGTTQEGGKREEERGSEGTTEGDVDRASTQSILTGLGARESRDLAAALASASVATHPDAQIFAAADRGNDAGFGEEREEHRKSGHGKEEKSGDSYIQGEQSSALSPLHLTTAVNSDSIDSGKASPISPKSASSPAEIETGGRSDLESNGHVLL